MNRPQPLSILAICEMFGVDPKAIPDMSKPGPMPVLEKKLKTFKEIFKKAYRKRAMEMHPDKGATKEQIEKFKQLTSIYKEFSKLKIIPIPRPQPRVVVRHYGWGGYSGTANTTTGGSWSGTYFYRSSNAGDDNTGSDT